ncbi:MAG: septum formation inhibitor Maf [Propionibacteriaceae bacterium]|nr:septum formation inhibitor Maf [Propionibacteriaceae bacterium]
MPALRLVLASASPARLATLRQAGLRPEVIVSGVDETLIAGLTAAEQACQLAVLKAQAVAERLAHQPRPAHRTDRDVTVVVGCDSLLELDGRAYGKPGTAALAEERWRLMRGKSAILHTGHHLMVMRENSVTARTCGAATTVHFANLSDAEIKAYVATGEPLAVAGAFTVDGLGGPFVTRLEGDYHNVVGISLPLLRRLLADLGVRWIDLWAAGAAQ